MLNTLIITFIILAICTMMILLFMIVRKDEQLELQRIELEKRKVEEKEQDNNIAALAELMKLYKDDL